MDDIDRKTYDLISGAGMESILMPRKQFVKEHKNLLKVLKSGDPKALAKEYKDQKEELEGSGLAEDKRYINSKTPYTLAKEMSKSKLMSYRDDPGVPPSMKDKLDAALVMKGGRMDPTRRRSSPLPPMMNPPYPVNVYDDNEVDLFLDYFDNFPELMEMWEADNGNTPYDILTYYVTDGSLEELSQQDVHTLLQAVTSQFEAYHASQLNGGLKGVSKQSGFIQRLMAEVKKKHGGEPYGDKPKLSSYKKPTAPLHPGSTMKKPATFNFKKLAAARQGGENEDDKYGASPFIVEHFGSGKEDDVQKEIRKRLAEKKKAKKKQVDVKPKEEEEVQEVEVPMTEETTFTYKIPSFLTINEKDPDWVNDSKRKYLRAIEEAKDILPDATIYGAEDGMKRPNEIRRLLAREDPAKLRDKVKDWLEKTKKGGYYQDDLMAFMEQLRYNASEAAR